MQLLPAAQVVGPVQRIPPHCPHFGAVPPFPVGILVSDDVAEVPILVVDVLIVGSTTDEEDDDPEVAPSGPETETVNSSISM